MSESDEKLKEAMKKMGLPSGEPELPPTSKKIISGPSLKKGEGVINPDKLSSKLKPLFNAQGAGNKGVNMDVSGKSEKFANRIKLNRGRGRGR